MTEWDIQSRSPECTGCHQLFADKQVYHTLLAFGEEGYSRRDLCRECFDRANRDGVASYWQAVYRVPEPPPPEPIEKDTAESLLRKLCESNDPSQVSALYILAVMLERKRILRHRDSVQSEDGRDMLVYEHAQTGESFTVTDPHLRLDQLQEVQQKVADLLSPKLAETPAAEPVTPAATESESVSSQ